ncbi:MAG: ABC transporter ATP-binding protein [Propionibacterium sp.]|nr:ABC transporter ATP-binding protein [Propionibacterium sp.]
MTTTTTEPVELNPYEEDPLLVVDALHTEIMTPRGALKAVDGVTFSLRQGETLGVVGESGSGKSVMGRTVMGLYRSGGNMNVSGQVLLEGEDIQSMTARELRRVWGSKVGMVFQDPMTALNPVKKIGTHLTETLKEHSKLDGKAARNRAEELLNLVGIPEPRRRLDQFPHEMSGGMRQRVVIAIALANNPRLLIADEPTTALDVTVQKQILDLLQRLQAELGMAVILISHNLGVVAGRADRVGVMYAGRFAELAPAKQLFADPRHHYTRALLAAIPKLEQPPHVRLDAIEGAPPNMVNPPHGCRFAPRCRAAQEDCTHVPPRLVPTDQSNLMGHKRHWYACYHPVSHDTPGGE